MFSPDTFPVGKVCWKQRCAESPDDLKVGGVVPILALLPVWQKGQIPQEEQQQIKQKIPHSGRIKGENTNIKTVFDFLKFPNSPGLRPPEGAGSYSIHTCIYHSLPLKIASGQLKNPYESNY